MLAAKELPKELVELVARRLGRSNATVAALLLRQCPDLHSKFAEALRVVKEEEARRRREVEEEARRLEKRAKLMKEEEVRREREAMEQRHHEAEQKRQATQALLRQIGRCVMGYDWIKQPNGGYRCAGGSHFVSAAEIM